MLRLEEVNTHYGESHVLQGINLEIAAGEVVCLLGRNGAGKTTTLRSIIGLTPPSRGTVTYKGTPIQGLPANRISRMGIGLVPEDRRIFAGLSVEENLEVAQRPLADAKRRWPLARIYELFPVLADRGSRPAPSQDLQPGCRRGDRSPRSGSCPSSTVRGLPRRPWHLRCDRWPLLGV